MRSLSSFPQNLSSSLCSPFSFPSFLKLHLIQINWKNKSEKIKRIKNEGKQKMKEQRKIKRKKKGKMRWRAEGRGRDSAEPSPMINGICSLQPYRVVRLGRRAFDPFEAWFMFDLSFRCHFFFQTYFCWFVEIHPPPCIKMAGMDLIFLALILLFSL